MLKKAFLFLIMATLPLTSTAKSSDYENVIVEKVISVYDADTFRVNISNWPSIIGNNMPVRLKHVDAPEIRGGCEIEKKWALLGRDFVRHQLEKAKVIELRDIERGKYFRLLSEVYIDGFPLSDMLIKNNLARSYEGGKRQGWCE